MTLDLSVGADWSEQYIDGEWNPSQSRETIVVEDPSTHEAIATVPASVEADVNAAYEAATKHRQSRRSNHLYAVKRS